MNRLFCFVFVFFSKKKWLTLAKGMMARKETKGEKKNKKILASIGYQDAQINTTVSFFVDEVTAKCKAHCTGAYQQRRFSRKSRTVHTDTGIQSRRILSPENFGYLRFLHNFKTAAQLTGGD